MWCQVTAEWAVSGLFLFFLTICWALPAPANWPAGLPVQ